MKLAFLRSERFWQYGIAIFIFILISQGYITDATLESILMIVGLLSGTSATVGTVDRFAEKMGAKDTK